MPKMPRLARSLPLLVLLALGACASEEAARRKNLIELYTGNAESYYQLGEHQRAMGQAMKGLDLEPENEKLKLILGWSLLRQGRTDDVRHAERVFRSLPESKDFRAPLGLAQALERQGTAHDEAADLIEGGKRVTEARDPAARVSELRARSLSLWTESLDWYTRALKLQPGHVDTLNGLQRVESLLGHPEASLAWSEKLIEALTTDRAFWQQRVLRPGVEQRQEDEFRRELRKITELEVLTRAHAARTLRDLGRAEAAVAHLDAALALSPGEAKLYGLRGQARSDLGQWDAAIQDLDRFIALSTAGFDDPDIQRAWELRRSCESAQSARRQP